MPPDDSRISICGCEDAPPVGQFNYRHAVRRLQQVPENERGGRSARRFICDLDPDQLCLRASAKSELNSPSEQHAADDAVAPADLRGPGIRSLGFAYDREFLLVAEATPVAATVV